MRDLRQAPGRVGLPAAAGRRRGDRLGARRHRRDARPTPTAAAIDESVAQAAPVLANLRNLALAERRAATDALTGLPNKRAVDDSSSAWPRRRAARLAAERDLPRPRPLQAHQRHLRPRPRRRGARGGRRACCAASCARATWPAAWAARSSSSSLPDTGRAGALEIAEKVRVGAPRGPRPRRRAAGDRELRRRDAARGHARDRHAAADRRPRALQRQAERPRPRRGAAGARPSRPRRG